MDTNNKKQKNKRKTLAVLPATVSSAVGIGGAAALTRAYLLRQQEYADKEKNASLYDKGDNGTEGVFGKNAGAEHYAADTNGDGVYTKTEYDAAVHSHYYNSDNTLKNGFDQEYVNSMTSQASNDPNFFITQKLYDSSKSGKLTTALTEANKGIAEGKKIATADLTTFLNTKVKDRRLTSEQLGKELDEYLTQLKTGTNPKYGKDEIAKVVNEVTGAKEAFTDTQVVNTKYADNAAVYDRMSNNATKQNFSFFDSLKDARETAATKVANNSLICKEIAKVTGADVADVASKTVDATATLGFGLAAGLATVGVNKLLNKVGNYFERKKEERAEKKEQKVAEMKRSLSQARAANAMRVQMAGDFENTASNGRFNNRG